MWQKCVEKKYRERKFVDVQTYLISMFIKTIFTTLLSFIKFIPILSLIINQIIIQNSTKYLRRLFMLPHRETYGDAK